MSKVQVISIDDKVLWYKTERGKEKNRKRVKESCGQADADQTIAEPLSWPT